MAFCRNCGTRLQGDERFCVGCGPEVSARGSGGDVPAAPGTVPAGQISQAPHFAAGPGISLVQGGYLPPGAIPIAVMPQPVQAKRGGWMKTLLVIAVLVGIGYYFIKHLPPTPTEPGANAALTKQQAFDAHWQAVYGFVQVSNGKWTNNAKVAIDSATLECDQYDASGRDLAQMRTTLNGPIQPGAMQSFNPFQMGAVATNVYKVTCTIVHVKQLGS